MNIFPILSLLVVSGSIAAPVDDPIRVDLPVYDVPQSQLDVQSLDTESQPSQTDGRNDQSIIGNLFAQKFEAANNLFGNKITNSQPVFEGAILEYEDLGSKALSVKENVQNVVAGLFQPKPLVDTINEEEKYGNNGDKFYGVGRAVVGGASSLSNLFNTIAEVPSTIFTKITRGVTEKLNNLGGKLIGL